MSCHFCYEIRVDGNLPDAWSEHFAGLIIHNEPGGQAVLTGPLPDQSALLGVLVKLNSLNIKLVSVSRTEIEE